MIGLLSSEKSSLAIPFQSTSVSISVDDNSEDLVKYGFVPPPTPIVTRGMKANVQLAKSNKPDNLSIAVIMLYIGW
eukprot:CAMPEP_0197239084 /NCGR_PEP_ID=MMETSP1429-20130617/5589_1 /TAXON_ID=49237 /ORGANISM="Chaetoceros  sp., Strain UNC1202" /LENGTH=75 /DNA_ID=CAMNT_0042698417 /DNA_START=680 /DNA_END=904 /DNA_ORIENTATION=-